MLCAPPMPERDQRGSLREAAVMAAGRGKPTALSRPATRYYHPVRAGDGSADQGKNDLAWVKGLVLIARGGPRSCFKGVLYIHV